VGVSLSDAIANAEKCFFPAKPEVHISKANGALFQSVSGASGVPK
jgi:hypothetical protein